MSDRMDRILDDCLTELTTGGASVEDCLLRYPEYADLLRPLLETALKIDGLERPQASRAGFHAGKKLMMEALVRREEKRALARVPKWGFLRERFALRPAGSWGGVALTRLTAVGLLGAGALLVWVAAAGVLLQLWHGSLLPQTAVVADASGIAQVQTGRDAAWQALIAGWALEPGQRIRTGDPSSVNVRFSDGSSTALGPNTELEIVQLAVRRDGRGQVIVLRQAVGSTHSLVETLPDSTMLFEIDTAGASVVAHGTEFKVLVNPDSSTSVVVLEGAVSVTGREATVTLTGGQAVVVGVGENPGPVVLASPEGLVESPSPESSPAGFPEGTATPETPIETATLAPASPAPALQLPTATPTSRPPSPTAVAAPPTPTATPEPPSATATSKPPSPTATTEPFTPTATPRAPTPTVTAEPPSPTPTSEPSPTLEPIEIVDIFYAYYTEDEEKLWVKARTSIVECALTLEGFGPMEAEGDHWVYIEESLDEDDVPSMVTVRSSCGGSSSGAVRWR